MSGHTKGRLTLDEFGDIRTESGDRLRLTGVALAGGNSFFNLAEDNRDRIVALWNAAEELGLTTEAIEAGALQRAFAVQRAADGRRELSTPNEDHQRCMHCGVYADECMCDGGRS